MRLRLVLVIAIVSVTVSAITLLSAAVPFERVAAQDRPQSPDYDPAEVSLPAQTPVAALGEQIFLENCAPCHGQSGDSDGPVIADLPSPPPPLSDPATIWDRSPAEEFHIIKFGRIGNLMPPWQNQLSDEQTWRVAYYAWSLHTDQETVEEGKALWEEVRKSFDTETEEQLTELLAPDTMRFRTQSELAEELLSLTSSSAAGETVIAWNDEERQSVLDYLRTQNYSPPWESAFQEGEGSIQGTVVLNKMVNDTLEEQPVVGISVTLSAYAGRMPIATFDTTTDDMGQFQFDNLATDSGIFYIVESRYNDIPYSGDVLELSTDPAVSTNLPVYETTDDPSGLTVSRMNWVIDFEPGALVIGQILSLRMREPATFVGRTVDSVDVPVTVQILLPEDAYDLQFQDGVLGGRYWQVGQSVYDSTPITPEAENRQIFLSYRLPIEGSSAQFSYEFLYPIERLNLLVADLPGLSAEVPQLEFIGNEAIQNVPYRLWNGASLEPGTIDVSLDGAIAAGEIDPRNSASDASTSDANRAANGLVESTPPLDPTVALAVGGLLFLLLVGLFTLAIIRQRGVDQMVAIREQRDRLIEEIARIDDQREMKQLDEATWTQKRATLKTHLLEVATYIAEVEKVNPPS